MVPNEILQNYRVILVAPRTPGNIGSIARLLANYECPDWFLVTPQCEWKNWDSRKLATGNADKRLDLACEVSSLKEALKGCHAAIGFTRRQGKERRPSVALPSIPELSGAQTGKIALVFGNEETGLSSEELALCSHTCALPVSESMGSLNLSHAVGVVLSRLFELQLGSSSAPLKRSAKGKRFKPAQLDTVMEMLEHWREFLTDIGMTQGGNPERMIQTLKKIYDRATLTEPELRAIRGVLSKAQVRIGTRIRGKRLEVISKITP